MLEIFFSIINGGLFLLASSDLHKYSPIIEIPIKPMQNSSAKYIQSILYTLIMLRLDMVIIAMIVKAIFIIAIILINLIGE